MTGFLGGEEFVWARTALSSGRLRHGGDVGWMGRAREREGGMGLWRRRWMDEGTF